MHSAVGLVFLRVFEDLIGRALKDFFILMSNLLSFSDRVSVTRRHFDSYYMTILSLFDDPNGAQVLFSAEPGPALAKSLLLWKGHRSSCSVTNHHDNSWNGKGNS